MKKIRRTQLHLTLIYFIPISILVLGLSVFILQNQRIIADEVRYSLVFVGDSMKMENENLYMDHMDHMDHMDDMADTSENAFLDDPAFDEVASRAQQYAAFDFTDDGEVNVEYLSLSEYDEAIDKLYSEILILILFIVPILLLFFGYLSYRLAGWVLRPLIQNQQQQKRFIDDASHELRTPVSLMRLEIDMEKQRNEEKTDRQKKMLMNIDRSVSQLEAIIRDLLAYARVGSFEQSLEIENLSVSQIADEIFSQFEKSFQNKKINAIKKIKPRMWLKTNNDLLRQMLVIGMDNALKHSNDEGDLVFELRKDKKNLVFQIKNTAKHLDDIDFTKITERFYRANNARTESGLGLGLSIAYSIAKKLGGKLVLKKEGDLFVFEYCSSS